MLASETKGHFLKCQVHRIALRDFCVNCVNCANFNVAGIRVSITVSL